MIYTGDLVCVMEWYKIAHDGPVTTVTRSPFFSDLVLTVGGYLYYKWLPLVILKFSMDILVWLFITGGWLPLCCVAGD